MEYVFEVAHKFAYVAIVITGIFGIYCCVYLWRQLSRRKFRSAAAEDDFVLQVREQIQEGDIDAAVELCKSPQFWYKSTATMAGLAIEKRNQPIAKLRNTLMGAFSREILTDLESTLANINMVVKAEPMLGLFGTVLGMIGAFTRIAHVENPTTQDLMRDLSIALYCTAGGLFSSIPLLMIGNWFQIRIRRMEETTFGYLGEILDDLQEQSNLVEAGRR